MIKYAVFALMLFVYPCHAFGAIAHVTTATGADISGSNVSSVATSAFNAVSGNIIVCGERHGAGAQSPTSLTDTASNTYTFVANADSGANDRLTVWYAAGITGNASNVVTVNFGQTHQYLEVVCLQYSGVATTSPLETSATGVELTGGLSHLVTGTFSTTTAATVAAAFGSMANLGIDFTPDSGYTERVDLSTMMAIDQIFSTAQTNITAGATASNTQQWEIVVAVFKQASTVSRNRLW